MGYVFDMFKASALYCKNICNSLIMPWTL